MKIGIDVMSSDNAPGIDVEGAVLAAREYEHHIVLVGNKDVIEKELEKYRPIPENISIEHASEVIGMHEQPVLSVRRKKNSSIVVLTNLAKEKKVDAIVSAGNTGAMVCAATLKCRLLPGIERAGIGIIMPTLKGTALMIDGGANIDAKPKHLLQYAIMGSAYSEYILNKRLPKVGLLNIGEEESKGTGFLKEAFGLLELSGLNFTGNVEGRDIFIGDCDVIVCDGLVGNVALKVTESIVHAIMEMLKSAFNSSLASKLGAFLSKRALRSLKKKMDSAEYGGAPLLGIDGICIICHGSSNAKAIKNAIRVAGEEVVKNVNRHIVESIS
ncbi:MAG: phosphate acyltransferase PlsX [Candidatus Omnitrophica bacterium]|nr:phosphate acyltransferase PlsX [Candidatus Omnitrophota bacterium]MBU4457200.1 phosphate acyltransferase PlsX [Candidatus Omnitrophota bacterium]